MLPDATPWAMTPAGALAAFATDENGLDEVEARARLGRYGPNRLADEGGPGRLGLVIKQFQSPLIYILVIAALVSIVLGHTVDAAVISVVLVFNAVIGYFQEARAEQAIRALQRLARSSARVIRAGTSALVDADELVPGDVLDIRGGDRVPADCRVVDGHGLEVDESILTGESAPVAKGKVAIEAATLLADRTNMVFAGTVVTRGRAKALVTGTGSHTELGQIAGTVREIGTVATPLQRRMSRFANLIGMAVVVVGAGIVAVGYALGQDVQELFFTVITLAVSAIPEGLPIVLTVALSVGVSRMAARNAIVRRLPAVETLGSCTVIGSDKTGTLTQNRMTVRRIVAGMRTYEVEGTGYESSGRVLADGEIVSSATPEHDALRLTLETAVLANEAAIEFGGDEYRADGDPTEAALLVSAAWGGVDIARLRRKYESWGELPFESSRQFAASFRSDAVRDFVFVKGSPEAVVRMCNRTFEQAEFDPDALLDTAASLADDGLRVLAMAYREIDTTGAPPEPFEPFNLIFLGFQAMWDPPREEARDAVKGCQSAGIRVLMITGDHAKTARSIARELGITGFVPGDDEVVDGADLAAVSDEDLPDLVRRISVFARVSPRDKLRIVQALQLMGEAVAMTGDGVNDAPALKAADIGIAMGRSGTDVAKEASDMIIADDNFASIHAAVEEGRYCFDNVRKATFFLVSSGVAEVVAVVSAIVFGFAIPFLPVQILWLNVVTNGVQDIALAFEPGEPRLMNEPPRPRTEGVLSRVLYERTLISGLWMALGTIGLFLFVRQEGASLEEARTIALTTMVLFQVIHAYNARSEYASVFSMSLWSNSFLLLGSLGAAGLHAVAVYWPPARNVLHLEPIGLAHLALVLAVVVTIIPVVEIHKRTRPPKRRPATAGGR